MVPFPTGSRVALLSLQGARPTIISPVWSLWPKELNNNKSSSPACTATAYSFPQCHGYEILPRGTKYGKSESHSVLSDSLQPHGLYSPWNSPGQNLEWVAFPLSRGSSQLRDLTQVSCIAGSFFTSWATREAWLLFPSSDSVFLTVESYELLGVFSSVWNTKPI